MTDREDATIAVLRHTLFLTSEQFIPLQVSRTPARVQMVARDAVVNPLPELPVRTIAEGGRLARYRYAAGSVAPLVHLLRQVRARGLHAHFGVEGMSSLPAARILDVPHFTTFHGYDATRSARSFIRSGKPSWMRYAIERRQLLSSETNIICVSSHLRDVLIRLGAAGDRIEVIPTGVDTAALQAAPAPDRAQILHVARLVEKKGTEYLIRALPEIIRRHPDTRLIVIGEGPLRPRLESLAATLNVRASVDFQGARPHREVLSTLRRSSLLVLPSVTASSGDQEGLGQVLLEAGAVGRPTVATRHGGIPDAVVDGQTGLLVDERNPGQIADAVSHVLSSTATQRRLGLAARHHVVENFDATVQATRLAALYERSL